MKHEPWPWRLPTDSAGVSIDAERAVADVRAAGGAGAVAIGAAGPRGTAVKALHSPANTASTTDAAVAVLLLGMLQIGSLDKVYSGVWESGSPLTSYEAWRHARGVGSAEPLDCASWS